MILSDGDPCPRCRATPIALTTVIFDELPLPTQHAMWAKHGPRAQYGVWFQGACKECGFVAYGGFGPGTHTGTFHDIEEKDHP